MFHQISDIIIPSPSFEGQLNDVHYIWFKIILIPNVKCWSVFPQLYLEFFEQSKFQPLDINKAIWCPSPPAVQGRAGPLWTCVRSSAQQASLAPKTRPENFKWKCLLQTVLGTGLNVWMIYEIKGRVQKKIRKKYGLLPNPPRTPPSIF